MASCHPPASKQAPIHVSATKFYIRLCPDPHVASSFALIIGCEYLASSNHLLARHLPNPSRYPPSKKRLKPFPSTSNPFIRCSSPPRKHRRHPHHRRRHHHHNSNTNLLPHRFLTVHIPTSLCHFALFQPHPQREDLVVQPMTLVFQSVLETQTPSLHHRITRILIRNLPSHSRCLRHLFTNVIAQPPLAIRSCPIFADLVPRFTSFARLPVPLPPHPHLQ